MYRVSVRHHFDTAHYLREYKGKCENLHGHRFQAVVTVETLKLDELGMALDFSDLKKHLKGILDRFDHACLNDIPPFDKINPSSENIACNIYEQLTPFFEGTNTSIHSVEVWESPNAWATYLP